MWTIQYLVHKPAEPARWHNYNSCENLDFALYQAEDLVNTVLKVRVRCGLISIDVEDVA